MSLFSKTFQGLVIFLAIFFLVLPGINAQDAIDGVEEKKEADMIKGEKGRGKSVQSIHDNDYFERFVLLTYSKLFLNIKIEFTLPYEYNYL